MGSIAAIHPGRIQQCFDHFVADLRGDGREATYFTVYAVEYSPELGTGHVAFLRIEGRTPDDDLDMTFTDTPEMAARMQARLRRMIATLDVSRGVGTRLDQVALPATFERLPWTDAGVGWHIRAEDGPTVEAHWTGGGAPIWTAAVAGTFTPERDILGMLAEFDSARVVVDGRVAPGRPYPDPWWESSRRSTLQLVARGARRSEPDARRVVVGRGLVATGVRRWAARVSHHTEPRAHPYIPNSAPETRRQMLAALGVASVDELYASVPRALLLRSAAEPARRP